MYRKGTKDGRQSGVSAWLEHVQYQENTQIFYLINELHAALCNCLWFVTFCKAPAGGDTKPDLLSQTTHTLTTLGQCLAQPFSVGGGGPSQDLVFISLTLLHDGWVTRSSLRKWVAFSPDLQPVMQQQQPERWQYMLAAWRIAPSTDFSTEQIDVILFKRYSILPIQTFTTRCHHTLHTCSRR